MSDNDQHRRFVPFSERFRSLRKEGTGRTLTNRIRLSTASIDSPHAPPACPVDEDDGRDGGAAKESHHHNHQQQQRTGGDGGVRSTDESSSDRIATTTASGATPASGAAPASGDGDDEVRHMRGIFESRGARTGIRFNTSKIERDEDGFFDVNDFFAKTRRAREQHIATVVSYRQQQQQRRHLQVSEERGSGGDRKRHSSNVFQIDANDLDISTTSSRITSTSSHTTKSMATTPEREIGTDLDDEVSYMSMTSITDDEDDDGSSSVSSYRYSDMDEGEELQDPSIPPLPPRLQAVKAHSVARTAIQTPSQSERDQSRVGRIPPAVASLLESNQKNQHRPGTPVIERRSGASLAVPTPLPTKHHRGESSSQSTNDDDDDEDIGSSGDSGRSSSSNSSRSSSSAKNRTNVRVQPARSVSNAAHTPATQSSQRIRRTRNFSIVREYSSDMERDHRMISPAEDGRTFPISPILPKSHQRPIVSPGFSPLIYRPPQRLVESDDTSNREPTVDIITSALPRRRTTRKSQQQQQQQPASAQSIRNRSASSSSSSSFSSQRQQPSVESGDLENDESDNLSSLGIENDLDLRLDLNTSIGSITAQSRSKGHAQEILKRRRTDNNKLAKNYHGEMDDDYGEIEEEDKEDDTAGFSHISHRPQQNVASMDLMDDENFKGDFAALQSSLPDSSSNQVQFQEERKQSNIPHAEMEMDLGFGDGGFDYGVDFGGQDMEENDVEADAGGENDTPPLAIANARQTDEMSTPKTPGLLAKVKPHTLASVRRSNRRKLTQEAIDNDDEPVDILTRSPFYKTRVKDRPVIYNVDLDQSDEDVLYDKDKSFVQSHSGDSHTSDEEGEDDKDAPNRSAAMDANDLSVIHHNDIAPSRPRRKRIPPLEFWRHEKLDDSKKHILRPKSPVPNRKRKSNVGSGPIEKKKGRFTVMTPDGQETKQTVVRTAEMVMEDIIEFDGLDVGELGIVSYFANPCGGNWRSGVLNVYPESEKPPQSSKGHTEVFSVVNGSVRVEINQSAFIARKGAQFFVPPNNTYTIINESTTQVCKLVYFSMGGTSSATNASSLTLNSSVMSADSVMPSPPRAKMNTLRRRQQQHDDSFEGQSENEEEDIDEQNDSEGGIFHPISANRRRSTPASDKRRRTPKRKPQYYTGKRRRRRSEASGKR